MPTAQQLTAPVAEHGEGPVWDAEGGRLLAVDLEQGDLLAVAPGGAVTTAHVGDALACLRPRSRGGWVLAARRRFALLDSVDALLAGSEQPRMLTPLWDDGRLRFNEGACDPWGRFWCGSMAYAGNDLSGEPVGVMWQLDAEGAARRVAEGLVVSNGLQWSRGGAGDGGWRAHFVDTDTGRVDVLLVDPATGDLLERRPWVDVAATTRGIGGHVGAAGEGVPDGLVVDAAGGVWVALNGAGAVVRYDADGALSEVVEVAVPGVTAATLGGTGAGDDGTRGGAVLYATTSTQGIDLDAHPASGAVFSLPVDVAALAPLRYAG